MFAGGAYNRRQDAGQSAIAPRLYSKPLLKRTDMGFDALSPWHLLILAAVFVVLFGSRKLPDAARSLGKSMRIFKAETKALRDGDYTGQDARQVQATEQAPQAQQPPVQQPPVQQPTGPQAPQFTPSASDETAGGTHLAEAQRNQPSA